MSKTQLNCDILNYMPSGGQNKIFSPEVCERVVEMMAQGVKHKDIAKEIGVSIGTLGVWRAKYPAFDDQCTRATYIASDAKVESLDDIADNEPDVQRAKLKCDNIKWQVSKIHPSKYGDRIAIDVTKTVDITAALTDARARAVPIRDQSNITDAEIVETKALPAPTTTDYKSVDASSPTIDPLDLLK